MAARRGAAATSTKTGRAYPLRPDALSVSCSGCVLFPLPPIVFADASGIQNQEGGAILRSTIDFPTVYFFVILINFFCRFFISRNIFREKNFEKKKTEKFDEKNFREINLRKKFKMENQRKNWRAEFFLKKLENREPSREKKFCSGKILQKKFCDKKNSNLGSSAASPPPVLWDPPRRGPLSRWREREGEMDGCPRRQTAAPPPASWASPPLAWGDPETRSRSHGVGQRRRKEKQ